MKTFLILFLALASPFILVAGEDRHQKRSRSDWYQHFDERLAAMEVQLATDMDAVQQQQQVLTEEMHRLNSKLENRFDKYFLWGYGTLMVVISTIASVIFTKQWIRKENALIPPYTLN
jgi:hypothetical protein